MIYLWSKFYYWQKKPKHKYVQSYQKGLISVYSWLQPVGGKKKKKTKAGQIVNYGLNNKSMIATDAHMLGAWEKRKTLLWQTNKNPNWQHMYISLIM